MYFSKFPYILYDDKYYVKDITKKIIADYSAVDDYVYFEKYTINDSDRPDLVADNFYDDSSKDWIVLLINNMTYEDWPLSENHIKSFVKEKYGDKVNDVHHWINDDGVIMQYKTPTSFTDENNNTIEWYFNDALGYGVETEGYIVANATPVSNEEYEIAKNNDKRSILILKKEFIRDFEREFELLMENEI